MTFDARDFTQVWPHFIGGRFDTADGGTLTVDDPASGEALAQIACADPATVERAVGAARAAYAASRRQAAHPRERARMLLRMADRIRAHRADGAHVLCLESGKPLRDAAGEFDEAARYFEYYAGIADKLEGKSIPLGGRVVDYTVHEPYGVSAQVIPWNFPVSLAARSLAPALAAGNAVVLKAPELAPLALVVLMLACAEADVPAGLVNLICGTGVDAGAALVAHAGVDQIVFTGSTATGRAILHAAAERAVPCVVELGGKSAAIVFDDADLERVLASVRTGIFFNAGQVCSALSRLLVQASAYDRTLAAIADMMGTLRVGRGIDDAELTPVISSAQRRRIAQMCDAATAAGARCVTGGAAARRPGFFFEPTLLADVTPGMAIAREEVFGPVLVTQPFETEEDAIALANGTDYGLVAGVFTQDLGRALRCAQRLDAGQVFVNEWYAGGIETPFGGRKRSGYGREKGVEAIFNYVQTKNIAIAL